MPTPSERLSRMMISGYKSIQSCDIRFDKINVLIGSNGAGKTNFISAFVLLQNVLAKNLQVFAAQSGIPSLFYNGRKETEEISFELFFGNHSYGFTLLPTDDNRLIFRQEFFGDDNEPGNNTAISGGHTEALWQTSAQDGPGDYVKPILAKQSWRVYHFHDTGRTSRMKQAHNLANNQALLNDAGNLAAFLYRLKQHFPQSYADIVRTVQLIAPYFYDFVLAPEEANLEQIVLRWQQADCEDVFNASQLSDGTLRFICIATLLLQPPELQPATIILDEPELGLHPYANTVFAEMVKRQLSDDKQVILSTQSVELLNEFDVEDVIVVDRSEHGSVFQRLDRASLDAWLENDYALGELWKKNLLGGRLSR